MLLAVEGGSFFSASSSGFSKGFTFLLSRDKDDGDSPMRVAPCNHYQLLVDKDHHPFLQLDSFKNRVSRGCASFSCFSCGGGGASAGLETTTTPCPPPKVEPPVVSSSPPESVSAVDTTPTTPSCPVKVDSSLQHPVVPESVTVPEKGKDQDGNKAEYDNTSKEASFKLSLRSSLKRPPSVAESRSLEGIKEDETLRVDDVTIGEDTGRRKVQWPDACGSELTQVREFEPSEMGFSDEEWETGRQRTCSCVIM